MTTLLTLVSVGVGADAAYIDPGEPWQTFVESFNGRLRDECLAVEHSTACSKPK